MEAEITLEYDNAKTAEAIANAVSPDNFKTPKSLSVKTARTERKVVTQIKCDGKFPTFIATIDDLLFCVSTAEKTLQATRRLDKLQWCAVRLGKVIAPLYIGSNSA